jgi:hypothetical protein
MSWTADSTVGILDKWFGAGGLGLNKNIFKYWNMDNEPEIWNGTHDDVMPVQLAAEDFMQRYFATAKLARAKFPEIKLCGPVVCNEWQWFNWNSSLISYGGKNYTWLEFFIKRIAEEQVASGIRLLDVLDLHFYPGETDTATILQLHRVFYDKTYVYPGANGIKKINGGWDNTQTKEYIFDRCNTWLNTYLGANHGVTLGLSEMDINNSSPKVTANWYASMLGTFADNGVEFFTPWSWRIGMWETLHLFSRYGKDIRVQSTSNTEQYVSAYSSLSNDLDSLTIILVNRSQTSTYSTTVNVSNFTAVNGNYSTLTLSNLGTSETFVSHAQNALVSGNATLTNGSLSVSLPPYSIKAILLAGNAPNSFEKFKETNLVYKAFYKKQGLIHVEYNLPSMENVSIELFNIQGQKVKIFENNHLQSGFNNNDFETYGLPKGLYILQFRTRTIKETSRVFIQ